MSLAPGELETLAVAGGLLVVALVLALARIVWPPS